MTTLALQVLPTGPSAPDYADIFQELRIAAWGIFGSDADLDPDSQDGQLLAVFARAIFDANQAAIDTYNSFSPATAQGQALSSNVKINGIARLVPTNSQCVVTIVGQAGTTINNGSIGDNLNLGTVWNLPPVVVVPIGGAIDVTATCTQPGAFAAQAHTLTSILTPTLGWQTVDNAAIATPGQPLESDATLRKRQSISVSFPASAIVEGIYAAISNLAGVGRLAIYENETDVTDGNGIPSHSISTVVEGGDVTLIANAIKSRKPPGTGTYGTTSKVVFDSKGVPLTINFFALTLVTITVNVTIKALPGYISSTGVAVRQAIVDFINTLTIGEISYLNRLFSPANLGGVGLGTTFAVTSLKQSRASDAPPAVQDVPIAFNEAASSVIANVVLTVT